MKLFDLREIGIPERLLIITDGGHDRPNELLAEAGEHTECTPEDSKLKLLLCHSVDPLGPIRGFRPPLQPAVRS